MSTPRAFGSGELKSELKWPKNIGNYIFRPSRAVNSIVSSWIRSKYKLIQAFMNEDEPIKNEDDRELTTLYFNFPDCQRNNNPVDGDGIWTKI